MDFKQLAKSLASETAKTVAGKATDVIDSNRDQLVADFEQAVARQRAEFIRELETISARIARAGITSAAIFAFAVVILAISLFLHH